MKIIERRKDIAKKYRAKIHNSVAKFAGAPISGRRLRPLYARVWKKSIIPMKRKLILINKKYRLSENRREFQAMVKIVQATKIEKNSTGMWNKL